MQLYSLLSFVAPSVFPISKLKTFVECFLQVKGKPITSSPSVTGGTHTSSFLTEDKQVATRLHSVLEPFLLRRTKSEVGHRCYVLSRSLQFLPQVLLDLPVKSEVILYTALSALQKKMYKAILTKDLG